MTCKHCRQQIGPESRFCDYCGKPVKGGRGWIPVLIFSLLLAAVAVGIWIWRNRGEDPSPGLPPQSTAVSAGLTGEPTRPVPETEPIVTQSPTEVRETVTPPPETTNPPETTLPPETTSPPETSLPPETTRPQQDVPVIAGFDPDFWDQDFYGFVLYTNSTGVYSDGAGDYLMEVILNEASDGGDFVMKGESCPADRANVICSFYLTDGVTSRGSLVSTELWLAGQEDQLWQIDPGTGFSMNYGDMICMGGHFEDEDGSFDYSFFLRPWGVRWEDVAVQYPDLLPQRYEQWYLPLIEAGQPMPEAFS